MRQFQLTAARRRLGKETSCKCKFKAVSTHSRPKAAGFTTINNAAGQPVSTHSRPKAAGDIQWDFYITMIVSTHSRPKAAGTSRVVAMILDNVSTHSRPKAAGNRPAQAPHHPVRFNSQPPEGGWVAQLSQFLDIGRFQLTAARRRLERPLLKHLTAKKFQLTAARRRLVRPMTWRS